LGIAIGIGVVVVFLAIPKSIKEDKNKHKGTEV